VARPQSGLGLWPWLELALVMGLCAYMAWRGRKRGTARWVWLGLAALLLASGLWLQSGGGPYAPVISGPSLNQPQARQVLKALLTNLYRAFDFKREALVYDVLARSVTGGLLEKVYLQSRQALAVKQAGGAQARVTGLRLKDLRLLPRPQSGGLALQAVWTVSGRVSHWGHTHMRTNLHKARIMLTVSGGVWKINALDIQEQSRVMANAIWRPGQKKP
jgi:hypothetical protein